MHFPDVVEIIEVGPRDGFQSIQNIIPTETKINTIEQLIACGLKRVEAASFVHYKSVPQMSDAKEVFTVLKQKYTDVHFIALTPNLQGAVKAMEAGVDEISYIISASERHNFENTKQSIRQSLKGLLEIRKLNKNLKIRLSIPTSFTCPWEGKILPEKVIDIIEHGLKAEVYEIGICDTIGSANPLQVKALLDVLIKKISKQSLFLHLHDSYGMGLANILMAVQTGITKFETSFGGLGGCPFVPEAAGNIATEDLVNMLDGMGISTNIDLNKLIKMTYNFKERIQVSTRSHMINRNEVP